MQTNRQLAHRLSQRIAGILNILCQQLAGRSEKSIPPPLAEALHQFTTYGFSRTCAALNIDQL